jgi:hypothetical protein
MVLTCLGPIQPVSLFNRIASDAPIAMFRMLAMSFVICKPQD